MSTSEDIAAEESAKPLTPVFQSAFLFLAALATGAYFCTRIYHPRLFGHLTVGNWIRSQSELPTKDLWTEMFNGSQWYPSGWLYDVLVAVVDTSFDFAGLVVLKAVLVGAFAITLAFCTYALTNSRFIGFVFALPAMAGVLFAVPLVPELVGYSLFVLVLFIAYRLISTESVSSLFVVYFIVCVIFANIAQALSLAVLFGLVLLCSESFNRKSLKLLLFAGLGLLALFCTPYLGANLEQLPEVLNASLFQLLSHQQPAHIFHYDFGFMLILGTCYFLMLHYAPQLLKKGEVSLIVATVFLAAAHNSVMPYALIVLSLASASLWGRSSDKNFGSFGIGLGKLGDKVAGFGVATKEGSLFCLAVCAFVFVFPLYQSPLDSSALPQEELGYLEGKQELMPLLHESFLGGFIVYRFADAAGNPVFKAAYDERTVWMDSQIAFSARQLDDLGFMWKDVFARTSPQSVICVDGSPLCEVLARDSEWHMVFEHKQVNDGARPMGPVWRWQIYARQGVGQAVDP